jgi:glycosyltransferase involved in cell wall biosynthesis
MPGVDGVPIAGGAGGDGDAESAGPRVGYVVKRYPRYSETFIVNEILAHEAAGLRVDLFALGASDDTHFQESISRVRAPLTYLKGDGLRAADFWEQVGALPGEAMAALAHVRGEPARDVYQGARLACLVRQRGIELLHAHFGTSAANVARIAARLAGVPFTFTAHAKDIFHESVRSDDLARKLREAAAIVTVSEFNRRHLRETYGADAAGVTRVYNGLNLGHFPFRGEMAGVGDIPVVVAVGRLVEKKGFDDLVRAAAALKSAGAEFRCKIVGHGEEAARLDALVRELDVGDRL